MDEIRLLIVEDSEDDAEIIVMQLERCGFEIDWTRVDTEPAFRDALSDQTWDLVISDYAMPEFDGMRAFTVFRQQSLDVPFIFVSGALGEERAVQAMRAGARDYLLKGDLGRLCAAVRRELNEAENRRQRRRAESEAQKEARRLAVAVEASGAGVFEFRLGPAAETYCSARFLSILGCAPDETPQGDVVGFLIERAHHEDAAGARLAHDRLLEGAEESCSLDVRVRHADESFRELLCLAKVTERGEDGRASHVVGVVLDQTDQRLVAEQLRQAQKMEAIGRLAGGVAHDFNNLLTVILSFGQFVLESLPADSESRDDVEQIIAAARRAESLTNQLLAFSRRQAIHPRVVDVNALIEDLGKMLPRLLGEDISYHTQLDPGLRRVRIDAGAFQQVLMNLAVNARDAMPNGGVLTIRTSNVQLDEAFGRARGVAVNPGPFVCIEVQDSGAGIDGETLKRVFEPFFTTKEEGRGTGLGLATCYGIAKQAGGYIWIASQPGGGTTVTVHLPGLSGGDQPAANGPTPDRRLDGQETVLVVEDNDALLSLAERALRARGYRVLTAASGPEALRLAGEQTARIDLLLADVVMPGMNGKALAEALRAQLPTLKVLFMSGYASTSAGSQSVLEGSEDLLRKPFTPNVLAVKVREVLDRADGLPAG